MANAKTLPSPPPLKNRKPLSDQSLAEILARRRESLEITIPEAEQATRIRGKYITAIEKGDYASLKDDVYARGYVKNYADFLGLDTKPILKLYDTERAGQREMQRQSRRRGEGTQLGLRPIKPSRFIITPRSFVILSVLSLLAVVVAYIVWQVITLSRPPQLILNNNEQRSVTTNFGYVAGRVEGGVDLFINDSPVLLAADGTFRERIAVVDGRNDIKLTAKNRLGKSVTANYVITAKLSADTPVAAPPQSATTPAPTPATSLFDGVQVSVALGDTATWLIIEADGKEIFRGTMVAGSTQLFSAADRLKISTGNAGKTRLMMTNTVVLNQDSGVLGADGETKRDLELTRTSKF